MCIGVHTPADHSCQWCSEGKGGTDVVIIRCRRYSSILHSDGVSIAWLQRVQNLRDFGYELHDSDGVTREQLGDNSHLGFQHIGSGCKSGLSRVSIWVFAPGLNPLSESLMRI